MMEVRDIETGKLLGTLDMEDPGTSMLVFPHPRPHQGKRYLWDFSMTIARWSPPLDHISDELLADPIALEQFRAPRRCLQAAEADLPTLRLMRKFKEA